MPSDIFKEEGNGIEFLVHLTPGAKKEAFVGIVFIKDHPYIKVTIHAKPTDNQANMALIEFISKKFKIAQSNIVIKKGLKSRNKKIFISNLTLKNIPKEVFCCKYFPQIT